MSHRLDAIQSPNGAPRTFFNEPRPALLLSSRQTPPSPSPSILTYISSVHPCVCFRSPRLLWSILCPMILYITPEQQSKHRAQSQASWASSKNRVRPDTNIYPSPSECPPAYLIVPPLLSYVPQILVAQIMMYAFSLPMIFSDFCCLSRRPPTPSFCSINVGWFFKFQQLCLLLNCPLSAK